MMVSTPNVDTLTEVAFTVVLICTRPIILKKNANEQCNNIWQN